MPFVNKKSQSNKKNPLQYATDPSLRSLKQLRRFVMEIRL